MPTGCYNASASNFFLNFSFRKKVLPQINLVLRIFGDSTTDCVTEKTLTQYLLKCKLKTAIKEFSFIRS